MEPKNGLNYRKALEELYPANAILETCQSKGSDVILLGGYEGRLLKELFFGSYIDRMLHGTVRMVRFCSYYLNCWIL